MKSVCVFCGSSPGARPDYGDAAEHVGQALVKRGIHLVYGGGSVGLMGRLARSVVTAGGNVTGVIPTDLLEREVALEGLSDLRVVDSMHERKALMVDLSDGFMALPGGFGTIEEFFEVMTWSQLGLHSKPGGLLNVEGYFDRLTGFLDVALEQQFIRAEHRSMILIRDDPDELLDALETYEAPSVDKAEWIRSLSNR